MGSGKASVSWKHGMHFCTEIESGQLMCDESSPVGRIYPSSPELLMASLGSCIGSVLVTYAGRHDFDLEGMVIELSWRTSEQPYRISRIEVAVKLPRRFSDQQRAVLERVAHSCLIHNTLTHPPEIAVSLLAESD